MSENETWEVDGRELKLTHLDKVLWPEDGFTKGDLLTYYRDLAPVVLPYFKDRPATFRVFPSGIEKAGYYRREIPGTAPDWMRSAEYETATDHHKTKLPLIDNAAGLLWFVNTGAIEFHLWNSIVPKLEEPNYLVFDLDPGDDAEFEQVLGAAAGVHSELTKLKLDGYAKTSGRAGMHIVVPLAPGYGFNEVREWSKSIAEQLAAAHPDLLAVSHGATHRGGLVTIDHAQNSIGKNTAAPYSVRGAPGAPVSMPVTWDEINAGKIRPEQFTMKTVPDRIEKLGDLFSPVLGKGHKLPEI